MLTAQNAVINTASMQSKTLTVAGKQRLCAKIGLFSQVGEFSFKQSFLHENPLLESRIMRSAASGGVSKAIAPA